MKVFVGWIQLLMLGHPELRHKGMRAHNIIQLLWPEALVKGDDDLHQQAHSGTM
jgi:hypothetical protein